MIKMSIGAAISETIAFLKANWMQMLMWLGGAVVLACLLGWLLLGSAMSSMMMSQGDPAAAIGVFAKIILFALIAGTIVFAASLLIWRSGLVGGDPAGDVGWGLGAGAAYMVAMMVVYIATVILMYIFLFIIGLLAFAVFGASGMSIESLATSGAGPGLIFFGALIYIAIIVFFLWFFGRLSVAGPLMAVERSSNPFSAFMESWRLTGASQWTIVGFNLIMMILFFIFAFIMSMLFGGMSPGMMGAPGAGAGSFIGVLLFVIVVYVPTILVSVSMPAAVYRCISAKSGSDVFA